MTLFQEKDTLHSVASIGVRRLMVAEVTGSINKGLDHSAGTILENLDNTGYGASLTLLRSNAEVGRNLPITNTSLSQRP